MLGIVEAVPPGTQCLLTLHCDYSLRCGSSNVVDSRAHVLTGHARLQTWDEQGRKAILS